LEYMHSRGIIHRDLRPEAMLLDKERNIKLINFGLAVKAEAEKRQPGMAHGGAPSYMAPEIILDDPDVPISEQVDIWSLGVSLYAMLTGSLPFSSSKVEDDAGNLHEDLNELFRTIVSGDLDIPGHLSPGCKEVLAGMLCADPTERLTIPKIRESPWYSTYAAKLAQEHSGPEVTGPANPTVIEELKGTGIDPEVLTNSLGNDTCNANTAAYHLLVRKRSRVRLKEKSADNASRHSISFGDEEGAGEDAENLTEVTAVLIISPSVDRRRMSGGRISSMQQRHGSVSHAHIDLPEAALEEIQSALGSMGIKWRREFQNSLTLRCTEDSRDIMFELRIDREGDQHKLVLHRLKGEMWEFKELAGDLFEQCQRSRKILLMSVR